MAQTYDLTNGKVSKLILKFFFPMFFTNMLQQIYSIADTAIVGKGLGDDSLAAVGNMSSLTFLIVGFSIGMTNGFSVSAAQYFGAQKYDKLRNTLASSLILSVIISAVLTAVSTVFLRSTLVMLQTPEIIIHESLRYGYIIFGGLTATIAYNLCACTLRALGDSKTPFIAIIISTLINICLDYVLIFIVKTGVEGAAAATVFAQLISALVCILKIRKIEIIKLGRADFKTHLSIYSELLKNGIPMAAMNSITAIGCMVIQYFVNGLGIAFTSAYSACSRFINLFIQPACTAGYTMSSFTSQNFGARRYTRIQEGLRVCLCISLVSYILLGSVMFFLPRQLAGIMLNGDEQISLAVIYLQRAGIMKFAVDFLFIYRCACQGMGHPVFPMVSGVSEMLMRVIVIVFFVSRLGFSSTAYAEIAAWIAALIINMAAFRFYYSKTLKESECTASSGTVEAAGGFVK
ncbi:MAG: MATE family efflux transporter [Oscillospiraceae bacterium]|nr:MATE family efflux transporter [Oscillospiraceae bacterium]